MQEFDVTAFMSAWHALWEDGDLDALNDFTGTEYVRINASSGSRTTLADFKGEVATIKAAFPDLHTEVQSVVVNGDRAAVFWHSEGTHTESFLGVPPTNRRVRTSGSNLMELADGRIAQEPVAWDGGELLASLGIRSLGETRRDTGSGVESDAANDVEPESLPDADAMKGFNRQFITGVTVLSTIADGKPKGLAVNSYASISLDPPLVLVCVQKTSSTYPALFSSTHVGINILAADQKETVGVFAKPGADKFATVDWHPGPEGSPLIDGSAAAIEAEICDRYQASTHTLFVCRVGHAELTESDPMIYRAGQLYHSRHLESL